MADSKITALDNLTSADPANDMIPIVDVSATPPASGNTKRISINNILACSPTATLASATITGDLTVDTSTLKVDSTNNRVGIGTASPNNTLTVRGSQDAGIEVNSADSNSSRIITAYDPANTRFYINSTSSGSGTVLPLDFLIGNSAQYRIAASGVFTWYDGAGGTRMTLNSTGLGVGASPSYQLHVAKAQASQTAVYIDNQQNNAAASSALTLSAYGGFWNLSVPHSATFVNPLIFKFGSTPMMTLDASGNLLVGTTVSPSGTKIGSIAKLGKVNVEGTNTVTVSTSVVALARAFDTGGLFFISGYNTSGGTQGWWLVAARGGTVTTIASDNTTGLTVAFTTPGSVLSMNTTSGTLSVSCISMTNQSV